MEFTTYKQVDMAVERLSAEKKYPEALALVERTLEQFPGQLIYSYFNKALFQLYLNNHEGALDTIAEMNRRGLAFPLSGVFKPLKELARYPEIEAQNSRLVAQARAEPTKMEYVVYLPEGYTEQKRYPLFLVLHGDGLGGNIEYQRWYWEPYMMLQHGMIVVYPQSSQIAFAGNYGWIKDYAISRQDLRDCYDRVSAQYAIDPQAVFIGGYSGGAIMAVETVMANDLPIKGLVGLCPEVMPPSFTQSNVLQARQRGVKIVFLEGELVALLPDEQEMINTFQEVGLPYQLYINPGVDHVFPENFGEKLDRAIAFITS